MDQSLVITDWLPIIMSAGSILVAIAVMMTRKDSSLHEKIKVQEATTEERMKTIFGMFDKIDLRLSNHISHADEKLDSIAECIGRIDKELYAHLKSSNKN